MGGTQSKLEAAPPTIDLASVATVPLNLAQDFGKQAQDAANAATAAASDLQRQNTWLSSLLYYGGILSVLIILGFVLYYFAWPPLKNLIFPPSSPSSAPLSTPLKKDTAKAPQIPIKSLWTPGGLKDAQETLTIKSDTLPKNGAYGYQFWMYVKDWNYKFGEEKHVFKRTDPSNTIASPMVTLHPSDNILRISVSVYPGEETSKNEPAPVGHSGATDDVFICEVPNVDIQKWVAVSITVDTKNLDVYFNGKLVKSCLLTGIPKPVLGDIIVNDNGGFSGYMCSFNSYSKALVPLDAQTFTLGGAPCSIPEATNSYVGQFAMFNSNGKEVTKYVF